jgi:hypothetical protein
MIIRSCVTVAGFTAAIFATNVLGSDSQMSPAQNGTPEFFRPHAHFDSRSASIFPFQRDSNHQQSMAYGTHQCQSQTSIGHTCQVSSLVTDCAEAYAVLKRQDCCGSTKEGGVSIGFTLGNCGAYAQPQR